MATTKENTGSPAGARRDNSGADSRAQQQRRRPVYNARRPRRPQPARGGAAVPIHIYPLGGLGEVART